MQNVYHRKSSRYFKIIGIEKRIRRKLIYKYEVGADLVDVTQASWIKQL